MEQQSQQRAREAFPPAWMLLPKLAPGSHSRAATVTSGVYPNEWSLSTDSGSPSRTAGTDSLASSQNTAKPEFSYALPVRDEAPMVVHAWPSTFDNKWTLPPPTTAGVRDHPQYLSHGWSPGMLTAASRPNFRPTIVESPHGSYPAAIPGNFIFQDFYNDTTSPQTSGGAVSSGSPNQSANDVVRRLVERTHQFTSNSAVSSGTGASGTSSIGNAVPGQVPFAPQLATVSSGSVSGYSPVFYQYPRPTGFDPPHITPQSMNKAETASAQSYKPPRPAGFGAENTSPNLSKSSQDDDT